MFEILAFRKLREMDDTEALRRVKMLESKLDASVAELEAKIEEIKSEVMKQTYNSSGNSDNKKQEADSSYSQSHEPQGN